MVAFLAILVENSNAENSCAGTNNGARQGNNGAMKMLVGLATLPPSAHDGT